MGKKMDIKTAIDYNFYNGAVLNKPSTDVEGIDTMTTSISSVLGQTITWTIPSPLPDGTSEEDFTFKVPSRVGYNLLGFTFDKSYRDPDEASLFVGVDGSQVTAYNTTQDGIVDVKNDAYRTLYAVWKAAE